MNYKTTAPRWLILLALFAGLLTARAQSTPFNYQGRLAFGGSPANGAYDLKFTLYATNGAIVVTAGPVTNNAVAVANGLFTTAIDFGPVFVGYNYWLEIAVQTNGGSGFATLSPRQQVTPAPYAALAGTASNVTSTISASQISGTIPVAQLGTVPVVLLPPGVVINSQTGVTLDGTFNGNGGSLTNLKSTALVNNVSLAQLPAGILTNGSTNVTLTGTFGGNGLNLTNINLTNLNTVGAITYRTNWGKFVLGSTLATAGGPTFVRAADVNGDGKLDLIYAVPNGNSLRILTNTGSGTFINSAALPGSTPYSFATADFNGDGKVDIVIANYGSSTLTLLTNNGSGGFGSVVTIASVSLPRFVLAVDLNHDGKMDLVCSSQGNNTLTLLLNNGTGVFGLYNTLDALASQAVLTTDLNRDSYPDLLTLDGQNLRIYTTASSATIGGPYDYGLGMYGMSANSGVIADLNGDGLPDLVLVDATNNLANRFFGGSTTVGGAPVFGAATALTAGLNPRDVAAADLNNDGKIDLIFANSGSNNLSMLINDGAGGFVTTNVTVGSNPYSVIAADVNGDGQPDLICANFGSTTLSVLINTPVYNAIFNGNGSGMVHLDASQFTTGTMALARFPSQVVTNQETNVTLDGTFSGNGSGLTNLNASSLTGIFSGNGSSLTNVNASSLGGTAITTNASGIIIGRNLGIGVTTFTQPLQVYNAYCNGNGFANASDRNLKRNFQAVDVPALLEKVSLLPMTEWQYQTETNGVKHLGPMAQDFHEAFGLNGQDDTHINSIDESGVALAALKGLDQDTQRLEEQNDLLKKQIEVLRYQLQSLKEKK